ncbi:diguanylate cyclase [Methylococcus capsulatus]|uniref:GGDEF family protein n=1 Tax=Methylococcus capsulatus (strain ATCC 33009 / NCIMB 11132 / Bath) TaxID=243233 RepID=Q60BL0_METCA|nr:diguanylate cyclase [Methylococcus capsulatus]AAU90382.1 GGDEF family protein [Methylococcus capsulatus str. Bath]QXP88726.1 sensor domain-containing diguanylate cyclase [Methylococcus capsulatus]QXP94242.1 sensor domain-containing diguanylate cyclase [Methylococcus capsulatus]UQN11005.1 sensor domain-containing diguanylate cyclase [Methylococcus capsulatus]
MPADWLARPRFVSAFSIVVFLLLAAFGEYVVRIEAERLRVIAQNQVLAEASTIRARLEGELYSTLYLANGLSSYVSAHKALDPAAVKIILSTVFGYGRHLRNIVLAPDNEVRFTYPLKGNEKVIGFRYQDNAEQWRAVKRAMETRTTVLSGPVDLVQGGRGLISRTPVFLPDGEYWGIVALVINIDSLFATINKDRRPARITWALRSNDETGEKGRILFGDAWLFDHDHVNLSIAIPGGSWELAATPAEGWRPPGKRLLVLRIATLALSGLIAALVFLVLFERIRIQHLALHDSLTDLPNRRLLDDRLERAIAQARRNRDGFALLYVDLDDFKPINDRFGHRAGDHVLVEIARRLRGALRRADTVARVGGDEFMLILPGARGRHGAMTVVQKLAGIICQPIGYKGQYLNVSASIGVSTYPENGVTADALISHADGSMYRFKQHRKSPTDINGNQRSGAVSSEVS